MFLLSASGPGATGELGLTMGSGPCVVNADGNSTSRRKFSFTDRANVVYIEYAFPIHETDQITDLHS